MALKYITPNEDFYWPNDGKKQCIRCFQRLERRQFHRQSKHSSGLHSYCKSCFKDYRRELAERKRQGDFKRMVHKASLCKKDKLVISWARKVLQRFGGAERCAEFVYRSIRDAAEADVPRVIVLEFFSMIYRVLHYEAEALNEIRKNQPRVETMTDTEIAAELRKIARRGPS